MGKIQVLADHLANQIAAGEVVERPASIVKELVENAIDAQASKITIEMQEGGIRYLRVSDNGIGMGQADAKLAFSRHATSKIRRERDLFAIRTLGFRGEALPSIASVARVKLTTAYDDAELATSIRIVGGEIDSIEETSRTRGTDVEVEDLFYNTPARLKYLKTVNTEVSHVADVVGRLALAHPDITFVLRQEKRELLRTSGDGKELHAIHALYGKQVASQMIAFEEEDFDLQIHGYFSKPELTRANRSYLSILLNGRYVRSIPIVQTILRAYGTYLPTGRYPVGVLYIQLEPKLMDVNVHPSKLEVRLSKEKELCRRIEEGIRKGLQSQHLVATPNRPKTQPVQKEPVTQEQFTWSMPDYTEHTKPEADVVQETQQKLAPSVPPSPAKEEPQPVVEQMQMQAVEEREEKEEQSQKLPSMTPLSQVHGTYIVAQTEDGFYLLDQHAAHERIYYEQFSHKMNERNQYGQPLLIPLTIECTPAEAELLRVYLADLRDWGLEMEPFGGSTYLVRSKPSWFPQAEEKELIHEIFALLKEKGKIETAELRDESAKMMSCKAAIKANRHLRRDEMEELLGRLNDCENPYTCPHGRPIFVHFSTYELEKMFKRVM